MAKNNYVIEQAKQLARMRTKVRVDTAYIGAGFILALKEKGADDEFIADVMILTNRIWTKLSAEHINPIKYCEEQTGFVVAVGEEADEVNSMFEE